jgi:hypothetical protein
LNFSKDACSWSWDAVAKPTEATKKRLKKTAKLANRSKGKANLRSHRTVGRNFIESSVVTWVNYERVAVVQENH